MKTFSLARRLLGLLIGSLVMVWAAMLLTGYLQARHEIDELADARLEQAARTLLVLDLKRLARLAQADAPAGEGGHHEAMPPPGASQPLAFQVRGEDGRLLLASRGAPPAAHALPAGHATSVIDGVAWRSFGIEDRKHEYFLSVLEPLAEREEPLAELARRMGQVLLWALPLLTLLAWLSIRRGLRPLARLSAAITERGSDHLEPIRMHGVPREVAVLVTALDRLLARLAASIEHERAFTANAAHELRTPLAAIRVQAEVALAATDAASRDQAIRRVIEGVDRSTHLAGQLLLLARMENAPVPEPATVDLGRLARDCLARHADAASRAGMEVALDAQAACPVHGDAAMLAILLDNLVDNAIRHGHSGGQLQVDVRTVDGGIELRVGDDGEGVPPELLPRLADRFFRAADSAVPGSGLGLSIVARIAETHGARLAFGEGPGGRGFLATLWLPAGADDERGSGQHPA